MPAETEPKSDFVRQEIEADLASGRCPGPVVTRFPPEPNGYLHIGHAKAICIDFGVAQEYGGRCHLRFDDTNPTREKQEYIDAIKEDIRWLGFDWGEHEYYASDYFEQLYEWACELIRKGLAYVDDQTPEQIRENRGDLTSPGTPSPFRDRSPEENLDLFARMRDGEFPDGSKVLRAKIDMASPNMNLRDPVMYRIMHATHHRTGDAWRIYPMYDWAHGQSDSIEKVTHSLCSLEFKSNRALYDWFIEKLDIFPSRQIEFARGNITYLITTKRRLIQLIEEGFVSGWDDPRMPTIRGMRRRGYPAQAIREFWEGVGVAKRDNNIEYSRLEHHVRECLNRTALRRMAVLDPIKVTITNWPDGVVEDMEAINNPEDAAAGKRLVPFSGELYIEREDFMIDPPKKFFRLGPGREVRLRYGYWITCNEYRTDDDGNVTELLCTYDPQTRGGDAPPDGRKVKGTLHWVSAAHAVEIELRQFEALFTRPDPLAIEEGREFTDNVNPDSLNVVRAVAEPCLREAEPGDVFQFERTGYYACDPDAREENPVFNRACTLKDAWARSQKKG